MKDTLTRAEEDKTVGEKVYDWLMTQDVGLVFNRFDVMNAVDCNSSGAVSGALHKMWNEKIIRLKERDGKLYIWRLVNKGYVEFPKARPNRQIGLTRTKRGDRKFIYQGQGLDRPATPRDVLQVATSLGMDLKATDPREKLSTKLLEIAVKLESMGL